MGTSVACPLADGVTPGSWLGGRRLVAIDGTCLDVADTVENDEFFGRPGVAKGERAAFPQARLVAVIECLTHAIFDAVTGPCTTGEVTMSRALAGRLQPGMLCLADRGLYGFKLWEQAANTGGLAPRLPGQCQLSVVAVFSRSVTPSRVGSPTARDPAQCNAPLAPLLRSPTVLEVDSGVIVAARTCLTGSRSSSRGLGRVVVVDRTGASAATVVVVDATGVTTATVVLSAVGACAGDRIIHRRLGHGSRDLECRDRSVRSSPRISCASGGGTRDHVFQRVVRPTRMRC